MALNWQEFQAGTGGAWRSRMVKGDALAASTHAVLRWRLCLKCARSFIERCWKEGANWLGDVGRQGLRCPIDVS